MSHVISQLSLSRLGNVEGFVMYAQLAILVAYSHFFLFGYLSRAQFLLNANARVDNASQTMNMNEI